LFRQNSKGLAEILLMEAQDFSFPAVLTIIAFHDVEPVMTLTYSHFRIAAGQKIPGFGR